MLRCKKLANMIHKGISIIYTRKRRNWPASKITPCMRERKRDTIFKKRYTFSISFSWNNNNNNDNNNIVQRKNSNSCSKVLRPGFFFYITFPEYFFPRECEKCRNRWIISTKVGVGKTREEQRGTMVETVGVGNHRCIGNCTLPVHDSFITHEFITSRLARNSWKAFSTKSDRCGEKKHGDDRSSQKNEYYHSFIFLSLFVDV